jgi:hypothetical protein
LDELTRTQERTLIDCLRALDGGATIDNCFVGSPEQTDSLHEYFGMRAQLLALKTTTPSPAAFTSGREALLARVVRPLANGHPGSTATQARQTRNPFWRPAARFALAGTLLVALAGCALGVSATAAGDRLSNALPDLPTINLPPQRPPYPFPQYNAAPPSALPTQESSPSSGGAAPQPTAEPSTAPSDSQDIGGAIDNKQPEPTKTADPADGWLPPQSAHETDPPDAVQTPEPPAADDSTPENDGLQDTGDAPDHGAPSDGDPSHNDPGAPDSGLTDATTPLDGGAVSD